MPTTLPNLIMTHKIDFAIIGLPFGARGEIYENTLRFKSLFESWKLSIPYTYVNEYESTHEAVGMLHGISPKYSTRKGLIDQVSA
jgi:RNase H-fold protein (predicted Holliday junction resolvase)